MSGKDTELDYIHLKHEWVQNDMATSGHSVTEALALWKSQHAHEEARVVGCVGVPCSADSSAGETDRAGKLHVTDDDPSSYLNCGLGYIGAR